MSSTNKDFVSIVLIKIFDHGFDVQLSRTDFLEKSCNYRVIAKDGYGKVFDVKRPSLTQAACSCLEEIEADFASMFDTPDFR